jgi:hypothetical protein
MNLDEKQRHDHIHNIKPATKLLDECLLIFPTHAIFDLRPFLKEHFNWTTQDMTSFRNLEPQFLNLAVNHFDYINIIQYQVWYELTDTGRKAQASGGHHKYQEILKKQLNRKRIKEDFDRLLVIFQVWTFWFVFIGGMIGLVLSFITYTHDKSTQYQLESLLHNQEILKQDQDKTKILLDSLQKPKADVSKAPNRPK